MRCTVIAAACVCLFSALHSGTASAAPVVDDQRGAATETFHDFGGVDLGTPLLTTGVVNDVNAARVRLAVPDGLGTLLTLPYEPQSARAWNKVYLKYTAASPGAVSLAVYDHNRAPIAHPLQLSPTSQPGYTAEADLSGLDLAAYPSLSFLVTLDGAGATFDPTVDDLLVTWAPLSRVDVGFVTGGAATTCTNDTITVDLPISVSFVRAEGLVVKLDTPTITNTTHAASNLEVVSVSHTSSTTSPGRINTGPAISFGQVTVQRGEVYWAFTGPVAAGSSFVLSVTYRIPAGIDDGTRFTTRAVAGASNANPTTTPALVIEAESAAQPHVEARYATTYASTTTTYAAPGETLSAYVRVENRAGRCDQALHGVVIVDSLAAFGAGNNPAFTDPPFAITHGGVFVPRNTSQAFLGRSINGPAVVWTASAIAPATAIERSYRITLDRAAPLGDLALGTQPTRHAYAVSTFDNATASDSRSLTVGLPDAPNGIFATGQHHLGTTQVSAASDDLQSLVVPSGLPFTFVLRAKNNGLSELNDVFMFFKVPAGLTFLDAGLSATGDLFYSAAGASNAPNSPPDFLANTLGSSWDLDQGAIAGPVRWLAIRTDLVSAYFGAAGPNMLDAQIDLVESTVHGACLPTSYEGIGAFYIGGHTPVGASSPVPDPSAAIITDAELLRTAPTQPRISGFGVNPDVGQRVGAGPIAYTFHVANDGGAIDTIDIGRNAVLTIDLPEVELGQGPRFLDFVSIDPVGGQVDLSALGTGHITVRWATLDVGSSRAVRLVLNWPTGGLDRDVALLRAFLSVDDDVCASQFASAATSTTLQVRPALNITKTADLDAAEANNSLVYEISVTNSGDGAATKTIAFDRIPPGLRFDQVVYHNGLGGQVYVSNAIPPALPLTFTNLAQFNAALLQSGLFVPATQYGGTWRSPYGANTTWVAIDFNDTSLSPPRLSTGVEVSALVVLTVGPNPAQTVFSNRAAVDADDITAAVSSAARTTMTGNPTARIVRATPEIIAGNETFTYTVTVTNGGSVSASALALTETLPAGLTYLSSTFAWTANSDPNPPVTPVANPDGSYTWQLDSTAGDIPKGQGAVITITAHADPGLINGAQLTIGSLATIANANVPAGLTNSATSVVTVSTADLAVDAVLDRSDPIANDRLTLSFTVDNLGLHHADDTGFSVSLPPELTYVANSAFIGVSGYSIAGGSGPTVVGNDLVWTNAFAHAGQPDGHLPGESGPIRVTLQLDVGAATPANFALPITVTAATTTGQGGATANDSITIDARTPKADPNVVTLAPKTARPSDTTSILLRYGNAKRQPATRTALVFELPHSGTALTTTLISATARAGETLYYRSGAVGGASPAFNPLNPGANGWTTDLASLGGALNPVTHIAIDTPSMPGNTTRDIVVRANFKSPVTGNLATGGSHHDTCTTLLPLGQDDASTGNNSSCKTIDIAALNLVASLSSSPSGSVPGVVAGASATHTATVTSTGSSPVFGTYLSFDRGLFGGGNSLPSYVEFVSADGAASTPVSPSGAAITQRVPVTIVGDRLYIGRKNGVAADALDYRNVGLRPDDHVTFVFTSHVPATTANKASLSATLTVGTDYGYDYNAGTTNPEPAADNTATASVTVYRPDLSVTMQASNLTSPASPAGVGERIQWEVGYNNVGDIAASGVSLTSSIAGGTAFVIGSLSDVPPGFTVEYLGPSGWAYQPSGASGTTDPAVRAVRVKGDSLSAPFNPTYSASASALQAGATGGTSYANGRISGSGGNSTWTSEVIGADQTIAQWTRVQFGERQGSDPLVVRVIDPSTGQTVPGFAAITADASNALDISGISASAYPTLRFEVSLPGNTASCDLTRGLSVAIEAPQPAYQWPDVRVRHTVGKWAYGAVNTPAQRATIWGPDGGGPDGWGGTLLPIYPGYASSQYWALGGDQDDPTTVIGVGGPGILSWTKDASGWTVHSVGPGLSANGALGQGYSARNEVVTTSLPLNRGHAYFDPTALTGVRVLRDLSPGEPGAVPDLTWTSGARVFALQATTGVPIYVTESTYTGDVTSVTVWTIEAEVVRGERLPGGTSSIGSVDGDRPIIIGMATLNGNSRPAIWTRVDGEWNLEFVNDSNGSSASMILADGSIYGYGPNYRRGFHQKRAGIWQFTPLAADSSVYYDVSESRNQLAARDNYLFARRQAPGNPYHPVIIRPPLPGDTEARTIDLGVEGNQFGPTGIELEYKAYFGNHTFLGTRWTGSQVGHIVALHVNGDTVSEFNADPTGLDARWNDPGSHMDRAGHVIRGVKVPANGSATWAWVADDEGGTIVDTFPAGYTGSTSNILPNPDGELFAYGYWGLGRLFGCGLGSDASFAGFSVGYRTGTSPTFAFNTEVLPGPCQAELSASTSALSANPDDNGANDTASASVELAHAELEITVVPDRAVIQPSSGHGYQIVVVNHGPGSASSVAVTVEGTFIQPPQVVGFIGTLAPGVAYQTGSSQGGPGLSVGDFMSFTARVSATSSDCDPSDNRATAATLISNAPNVYVDLEVPTLAFIGKPFPIIVRYGNNSDVATEPGSVDIQLPNDLSLEPGSVASIAVPALGPGATGETTLFVVANANLLGQSATTSATIAVADDLLPGDNESFRTTSFQDAGGQLGVAMFADRASVAVGDEAGFIVLFDNHGVSTATDTTLVATLPSGTTLVAGSTTGTYNGSNRTITWNLGELGSEQHGAVGFAVVANSAGVLTATVDIAAAADDSADTHAEAAVTAVNSGLRIISSVDQLSTDTTPGTLEHTVVVTNDTSSPTTIALADLIPAGTAYVPGSISGPAGSGDDSNPSGLAWNLTLDPGESATLRFSTSAPTTPGTIVNSATSGAATSNPSPVVTSNTSLPTLVTSASAQWLTTSDALVVTIAYENPGEPLVGATLRQLIGEDFTLASFGTATQTGSLLTWSLGDLASGASGSVTFTLLANDPGPFVIARASLTGAPGQIGSPGAPPQLSNTVLGVAVDPCSDESPCTLDAIVVENEGCVLPAVADGSPCSDALPCTAESCQAGVCTGTGPTSCDDDDFCTTDTCDPAEGCEHAAVSCEDGASCTTDACDPLVGCVNEPHDADCGTSVLCQVATCEPSEPGSDATTGCLFRPAPDGTDVGVAPCGRGICATTGPLLCAGGVPVSGCEPLDVATTEICDNGLDDDCDGQVNVGTTYCGSGPCATTGTVICDAGVLGNDTCLPLPNQGAELCNGFDDDCDGVLDNDVPAGTIGCTMAGGCSGVSAAVCEGGEFVAVPGATCALAAPIIDGCDGQDNNCDGSVDEGFVSETMSCGDNACGVGEGQTTCVGGEPGDTCDGIWSDIPDTICGDGATGLNVAYIVVTDGSGRAVGSIRCYQDLAAGTVACDTDPGTNRVTVSDTLLCEGVAP